MNMIFQLLTLKSQWNQPLINVSIIILGRLLDLVSTRYISKGIKLETNLLAKSIGQRGMILMQIPIIILGALDFYFSLFIFQWRIFLFANNIEGSWNIKGAGEDTYHKELESMVKNLQVKKLYLIKYRIYLNLHQLESLFLSFYLYITISQLFL